MKISTPCQKVCKISRKKCTCCKRTLNDIKNWLNYPEPKRLDIMSEL